MAAHRNKIIFTLLLGCLLTTVYSDEAKCEKLDAKIACCQPKIEKIRLESWNFAYSKRDMAVSSMVVHKKQSKSACTRGESFGFDGEKVWVDKGCRADFNVTVVCCETQTDIVKMWSKYFKRVEVDMVVSNMTVRKRDSRTPCIEGETFGFNETTIWVDNGCRARFDIVVACPAGCKPSIKTVRLWSLGYKYLEEKMTVSSMTVEAKQSRSSCVLGKSFGFDTEKIWVDKGCRADFEVTIVSCE